LNQHATIEKLREGDTALFDDVVNRWQDMVYNTAISIVQNEQDAEDITQDVFIKLHESLASFRGEALLSTWLYRVTINKSLDHEKKKNRQKRGGYIKSIFTTYEGLVHFEHPGALTENKEKAVILFQALKKLPDSQRIAFILHKIEGRSYNEIASIMENSLMAVESLLARAKRNMRKTLINWYEKNNE